MAQKQATRTNQSITLKGSTAIVTEFFEYSVNSILYQRGVYPSDDFRIVKKYGLPMLVTADEELKEYISTVLSQVQEWLLSSSLSRIVLAIKSTESGETLERWQFDIYTDDSVHSSLPGGPSKQVKTKQKEKTEKEVQGEIREIMKQITSSVTFLPILEEECTFTILAYTNDSPDVAIPAEWGDTGPHLIDKGKVEQAMVAYRVGE
nr:mitotic spindle assembly checkpoint protein MAD2 [Cryptococcus depauperatus CBS 7841]ODO02414.1 mitotic spindle assembly checkpoint protein MAD2 [Cryptococcus depauperatus CBS 7855]